MRGPQPAVIDADPGLDDALALALALRSEALDVRAISVVAGNMPLSVCTGNVLRILEALDVDPAPDVFAGCAEPLSPPVARAAHVHGPDGLGGVAREFPIDRLRVSPKPAPEAIVDLARRYRSELVLVALGPLTNVAVALDLDAEAMASIGKLVVMGGSADGRGNVTPCAEFNFYSDPAAARAVVRSGLPVTLVGLNVTEAALLPQARFNRWWQAMPDGRRRRLLAAVAKPCFDFGRREHAADACVLHDPLAVAAAIDPGLVRTECLPCDVVADPGLTRGSLILNRSERAGGASSVEVAMAVDADRFLDLFLKTVCGA